MELRTLTLTGLDPAAHGEQHGEAFRDDIQAAFELRLRLTLERTDLETRDNVLELARHHLEPLRAFDADLYAELCGIARGAGLSPEAVVVLNHYTDLRDLGLKDLRRLRGDPDGCSAWFVDDGEPAGERFLGQTWDMHGSATPYALLLTVPHARGTQVFFTITGCLGMTGMSSWGTALTINNLNSTDATVGVVWPAMVRRCVKQPTAREALHVAMSGPIGSGRHYIFADEHEAYAIETSGTVKKQVWSHTHRTSTEHEAKPASWFHTNHCLDASVAAHNRVLPNSTTVQRYEALKAREQSGRRPRTPRALYDAFADVSLPWDRARPDEVATCGALVMDIRRRQALACIGLPAEHEPLLVDLSR
jgi:isopenicillin-N N-acyltransferase-like protein